MTGDRLAAGLVLLASVAPFAGSLDVGFLSDDYPIIAHLWPDPGGRTLEAFTGSFLGLEAIRFYRPLTVATFAADVALYGLDPAGYRLQNALWHAVNALLVLLVARALTGRRGVALAAGLLFALHPFAPNTVACAVAYALSLLAKESGLFLLPVLLLLDGRRLRRRAAWTPHLALGAVTLVYLAARAAALGTPLGGYQEFNPPEGALAGRIGGLLGKLVTSLGTLLAPLAPRFGPGRAGWAVAAAAPLLLGGIAWALLDRRGARAAAAGAALFLAQCAAVASDPVLAIENAERWYPALGGAAIVFALFLSGWRRLFPIVTGALLAFHAVALVRHQAGYREAGALAERVRRVLWEERGAPDEPHFVVHLPLTWGGAPFFHWGLQDAMAPPFAPERVNVYPVPPGELFDVPGLGVSPIAGLVRRERRARAFFFDVAGGGFARVPDESLEELCGLKARDALPRIAVVDPPAARTGRFPFAPALEAPGCARLRLHVFTNQGALWLLRRTAGGAFREDLTFPVRSLMEFHRDRSRPVEAFFLAEGYGERLEDGPRAASGVVTLALR
jgi:hypothetical protein